MTRSTCCYFHDLASGDFEFLSKGDKVNFNKIYYWIILIQMANALASTGHAGVASAQTSQVLGLIA